MGISETLVERWMIPRSGIPERVTLIKGNGYYFFSGTALIASPVFETEIDALQESLERANKARKAAEVHYSLLLSRITEVNDSKGVKN